MSSPIRFGSGVAIAALVACASVGCNKSAPPAPAARAEVAAAATSTPWTNTSNGIEIGRFGVNEPRADGRACWTAKYSISIGAKSLKVETCVDDDPIVRDVTLTDADIRSIQTSLAALRDAPTATAKCDSAGSTYLVQIQDQSRKVSHYTDSANTCHAGDMGTIDRTTLEALFSTLTAIEPSARS
jgi:hypothetical protein